MPKTKISEYSVTNSSNTDIEGINIDEGCAPSGINNAIRELMVHLKEFQTGASGDAFTFAGGVLISGTANTITGNVLMSGTNTITGSTTATFAAGAVGTPSIAAHGDTNTGIFFPAADTIAFAEGGAEALRINSSGQSEFTDGTVSLPSVTNSGDTNTGVYFPAADEVAVAAGGSVAAAFNSHQFMGMRNRIINGDMRIDQRNAGASVGTGSGSTVYTVDRWQAQYEATSKFTVQQSTVAPTGFVNSLLVTSSSAYSPTSTQWFAVAQNIEGVNIADLGWGAAGAQSITVSFWVRSSLTGTFGGSVTNASWGRSYPFSYTISAANTWEQKTVTIAGDTTGTWNTNTSTGLTLRFSLGTGSSISNTAGAWYGSQVFAPTGATSVVGTNGATFYITGVQLEVGSTATPFERRPYGTELMLCQRYYQIVRGNIRSYTTASNYISVPLPYLVEMRAAPTVTQSGGTADNSASSIVEDITAQGARFTQQATATGMVAYVNREIRLSIEL